MNIALCTDEKYAFPCGVCITSILENNKDEECNIYILTSGLTNKTTRKFNELSKCYNQNIEIITIDNNSFNNLKVCDRFPISIYYRFLLPQLLANLDKVLYLDCDIIVTESITSLWNTNINEYACGVIEDQCSDDITLHNRIDCYDKYFNSGVLLLNLKYWRKHHLSNILVEFISKKPEKCLYPDQDALNATISDKVLFLEYKYNYQQLFFVKKENLLLHKNKWGNLLKKDEIPTIIHFTSSIKPWHKGCTNPLKSFFIKYKEISLWKEHKIKSRYRFIEKVNLIIRHAVDILRN